MKKKILMITQNFAPEIGSAANRMVGIADSLNKHFEVTVLTTEPQYPKKEIYKDTEFCEESLSSYCIRRIQITTNHFERNLFNRFCLYVEVLLRMLNRIRKDKEKYDIIFVTSPPLSIPLVGLVAKRKFKAQLIIDIRDLWPESFSIFKGAIPKILRYLTYSVERKILQKADKVIINSEGFLPYIRKIVGNKKKIYFLPNSLTGEELAFERKENPKEDITIIYAGNMGYAQDLESFFLLAKQFEKNSRVGFLLIGYGANYEKIKEKIKADKVNMEIKPPEPRKKVLERLHRADIAYVGLKDFLVFQTVLPGKIIDYMSASLPIIGVTVGYSKKLIEESGSGVVSQKGDIEQMVAYIEEWIDDPKKRMEYGENGKKFAEKHYNWQYNKEKLVKIIVEE